MALEGPAHAREVGLEARDLALPRGEIRLDRLQAARVGDGAPERQRSIEVAVGQRADAGGGGQLVEREGVPLLGQALEGAPQLPDAGLGARPVRDDVGVGAQPVDGAIGCGDAAAQLTERAAHGFVARRAERLDLGLGRYREGGPDGGCP